MNSARISTLLLLIFAGAWFADDSSAQPKTTPVTEKQAQPVNAIEITPVEVIPTETVDVDDAEDETVEGGFIDVVGRLHPPAVHFPIAMVCFLLLVEVLALGLGRRRFQEIGLFTAAAATLSFLPAVVTGLLRAAAMPMVQEAALLTSTHRNIMIASAVAMVTALIIRIAGGRKIARGVKWIRWIYLSLVLTAALLALYGGHLGGALVFGEDYSPL